jgi:ADP-ribose pyrophosphatase YjhB (NUDIX family)
LATSKPLIERKLYKKISSSVPIACVDILVRNKSGGTLLVKRNNHPLKGMWWVIGGRVLIGEDPIKAVRRKAMEEAGLKVSVPRFVGYYSDVFDQNVFQSVECQTISLVFECRALKSDVVLDSQSSGFKWATKLPKRFMTKLVKR